MPTKITPSKKEGKNENGVMEEYYEYGVAGIGGTKTMVYITPEEITVWDHGQHDAFEPELLFQKSIV